MNSSFDTKHISNKQLTNIFQVSKWFCVTEVVSQVSHALGQEEEYGVSATKGIFFSHGFGTFQRPPIQLMALAQVYKPRSRLDARRTLPFLPGSNWRSVRPARGIAENFPGSHRHFYFSVAFELSGKHQKLLLASALKRTGPCYHPVKNALGSQDHHITTCRPCALVAAVSTPLQYLICHVQSSCVSTSKLGGGHAYPRGTSCRSNSISKLMFLLLQLRTWQRFFLTSLQWL